MDAQIQDVMKKNIKTVSKDATFYEVLSQMICQKSNVVLIVDEAGKLVGMADAFGLIREVLPDYVEDDSVAAHFATEEIFQDDCLKAKNVAVEHFMEETPVTITQSGSLMEAAVMALTKKSERIPVVDDEGKPIGLLTRTEIKQVIGKYLGIDGCFEEEAPTQ